MTTQNKRIPTYRALGFVLMTTCAAISTLLGSPAAQAGVDGSNPEASLIKASNGMLYGTTRFGGTSHNGIVFRMSPTGMPYKVIYNFGTGNDGNSPAAAVIQASNGALYGTTVFGGLYGEGTVFTMALDGTGYNILHNFGSGSDGQSPLAALVQGSNGLLYGTTEAGGKQFDGTVFSMNLAGGAYKTLHSFGSGNDGAGSYAPLIQGSDNAFYGTCFQGGAHGSGCVFKIVPNTSYKVLHSFGNENDGQNPQSPVFEADNDVLYGTTESGGTHGGGILFQLELAGTGYKVLHSFGAGNDGKSPESGLQEDSDGVLRGTTYDGGTQGFGTIFTQAIGGDYAVEYSLHNAPLGSRSVAAILQPDGTGTIYGTAIYGGSQHFGAVFSIEPGGTDYVNTHSFNGPQ